MKILQSNFFICKELATQEKGSRCFNINITVTHGDFKIFEITTEFVLSFSLNLASNFTPTGSCVKNNDLCFKMKNPISINLNCLIDLASRMELSNLLRS